MPAGRPAANSPLTAAAAATTTTAPVKQVCNDPPRPLSPARQASAGGRPLRLAYPTRRRCLANTAARGSHVTDNRVSCVPPDDAAPAASTFELQRGGLGGDVGATSAASGPRGRPNSAFYGATVAPAHARFVAGAPTARLGQRGSTGRSPRTSSASDNTPGSLASLCAACFLSIRSSPLS